MNATPSKPLPDGVQRVAQALSRAGHPHAPQLLDAAARTAQQAADALAIELGQIAKSIIFRRLSDDAAVLVVTSGDRRVDEAKVETLVGPLGRADAAFVKSRTGFSIGGVPPLAHASESVTLIDRDLFRFHEIWAAAGHPHAVFKLRPQDLCRLSGAPVADVVQGAPALAMPSPCVSVCRMMEATGLCEGCQRTMEEIVQWGNTDDEGRRAIWSLIVQRRKAGTT
jgi:prolyl-tRNA editing enzyme YbaK/EbsC (Cys-tRNA(Pro) deacylase)/predicted Fe-S protein YdhL (DUF1289 family)